MVAKSGGAVFPLERLLHAPMTPFQPVCAGGPGWSLDLEYLGNAEHLSYPYVVEIEDTVSLRYSPHAHSVAE